MQPASNRSFFFPRVSLEWKARLRHENRNIIPWHEYSSVIWFLRDMKECIGQLKASDRCQDQKNEKVQAFVDSLVNWNGKSTLEWYLSIDVAIRKSKWQTKTKNSTRDENYYHNSNKNSCQILVLWLNEIYIWFIGFFYAYRIFYL